MNHAFRKLTVDDVNRITDWNNTSEKELIHYAFCVSADPEKKKRLSENLCKRCYYDGPRIAGAAMTTWYCSICEKESLHGNTNTPRLCGECAKKNSLCFECGGSVRGKPIKELQK